MKTNFVVRKPIGVICKKHPANMVSPEKQKEQIESGKLIAREMFRKIFHSEPKHIIIAR